MQYSFRYDQAETCVRSDFAAQGMMKTLDAEMLRLEPGFCEISAPLHEKTSQQNGFAHAGLAFSIGDNAAGFAAQSLMAEGMGVLTTEMKIHLLAPATGDYLVARGQVLRPGRTLTVSESKVFAVKDGCEKLVASLIGSMFAQPKTAGA